MQAKAGVARLVQTYVDIEDMTAATLCLLIYGGDEYLNEQNARDAVYRLLEEHRDAEIGTRDARSADANSFDEAVSPSLLSQRSVVWSNMRRTPTPDCSTPSWPTPTKQTGTQKRRRW